MDPHTAVASNVLRQYRLSKADRTPTVLVSTASPYKFSRDVLTGVTGAGSEKGLNAFTCSERLEEISGIPMPVQVRQLRDLPVRHTAECEPEGMGQAVLDAFSR